MKKIVGTIVIMSFMGVMMTGCGSKESAGWDNTNEVSVISREDGSGTRTAFVELTGVLIKEDDGEKVDYTTPNAIVINSTHVMLTSVSSDKYAIGYVSLGSLNDTVKAVKVNGVEATAENIKNGDYAVQRPFILATKGEVSAVTQDFVNYILSSDGQQIIEKTGYIAIDDGASSFTSTKATGKIVVAGSSSVTPVMEKLKEAYLEINTEAEIEIQESDSTTGMESAIVGSCDIGMASREIKESELSEGLVGTAIAKDGIVVIVNKKNENDNLSSEEIMKIYTGEVLTWDEIAK